MRGIIPNRPRQERIDNASWFSRRDLSDLQSVFSFFVQILHKKVQVWEDEYVLTLFFSSLFSLGRWSNWPAMHHPRQGQPSGGHSVYLRKPVIFLSLAFNKHRIKICVSCYWRCRGTSAPTHMASRGPLRGAASAQWSKMETRERFSQTR